MKSETFEEAKEYYNNNKENLIQILLEEQKREIEYQGEWNQVAAMFDGFSLCYQDSDMNGEGKGGAHWNNDGANSGVRELRDILANDSRFQPLIADGEYWLYEYLEAVVSDFCNAYAEKNSIAEMLKGNDE